MAPNAIVSSVALTYVDAAPVVPAWSRWDDSEPFWGGGGIENQTDFSLYSTAFSVTTSTGMLTAAPSTPIGRRSGPPGRTGRRRSGGPTGTPP